MILDTAGISTCIAAIGALGTAAFGLVDSLKTLPNGGISESGFSFIEQGIAPFFGNETRKNASADTKGADLKRLYDTLLGNWINGRAMADQKAIAKSLIKIRLNDATAPAFASVTNVDVSGLKEVGAKMARGESLSMEDSNVLGRFDLALTAILDGAYQHADQKYRNVSKSAATGIAVILAVIGAAVITKNSVGSGTWWVDIGVAALAGLVAAPLAPMTKDLASALQAGVKVAQTIRSST